MLTWPKQTQEVATCTIGLRSQPEDFLSRAGRYQAWPSPVDAHRKLWGSAETMRQTAVIALLTGLRERSSSSRRRRRRSRRMRRRRRRTRTTTTTTITTTTTSIRRRRRRRRTLSTLDQSGGWSLVQLLSYPRLTLGMEELQRNICHDMLKVPAACQVAIRVRST